MCLSLYITNDYTIHPAPPAVHLCILPSCAVPLAVCPLLLDSCSQPSPVFLPRTMRTTHDGPSRLFRLDIVNRKWKIENALPRP